MTKGDAPLAIARWLAAFEADLRTQNIDAALSRFEPDGFWRDLVAFTWNIKTLEGREAIGDMLRATLGSTAPTAWTATGEASEANGITEGWFRFETAIARGVGYVRLRDGRAWTLLTAMTELKGFEEPRGPTRPHGVEHGVVKGRKSWLERREAEAAALGTTVQPYVVIIGGGQGGIALGARLKRLGVPTLIIEQNERPGDSWRKRYKSLCLHDPIWYDHLPYLPFPDHWPVFTPKDQIGDWLEMYTNVMELDYWGSTRCERARFDDSAGEWVVEVTRAGRPMTLRPKQLVFATGALGVPNLPSFPGADRFKGVAVHSSKHKGGDGWAGKRAVIIGANNSAHDIAADLWEHGAEVTMIQRSPTLVVKSETLLREAMAPLYSEAAVARGVTTDKADLTFASMPYRLAPLGQIPLYERIAALDAPFYDRLVNAGFMLDWGEDKSGLMMKALRRGSGIYIDVGASELVANGEVKVRSRVDVAEITETGVALSDGSTLPADLIVYATGYGPMNGWVAELIDRATADKVGICWGLGSDTAKDPGPWEGELRNMWKPTQVEGLWFHGGNLALSRFHSLHLALQLKARMEGLATPVYGLQASHNPR